MGNVPGDKIAAVEQRTLRGVNFGQERRAVPRASLDANMAAAAHYMLARFHVCAAQA